MSEIQKHSFKEYLVREPVVFLLVLALLHVVYSLHLTVTAIKDTVTSTICYMDMELITYLDEGLRTETVLQLYTSMELQHCTGFLTIVLLYTNLYKPTKHTSNLEAQQATCNGIHININSITRLMSSNFSLYYTAWVD